MSNLKVDLSGQVALITGAGNGIGKECALRMAESGAAVVLADIAPSALEQVKEEIAAMNGQAISFLCDITKISDVRQMMNMVSQELGRLDILVNSAGINIQQKAEEVTEEAWDKVMNLNVKGLFFCCQAAGQVMIPQKKGKIINITSAMALVGYYRRSAYCASKGAVSQLAKVLAVEWAPYNITVNNVAPTFIKTPFTEPMFQEPGFLDDVISRIPLGRVGDPGDVVGAVLYLASDTADLVTGTTIVVDGGWVAW